MKVLNGIEFLKFKTSHFVTHVEYSLIRNNVFAKTFSFYT